MIRRRSTNLTRHGLVDFGDPIFSSLFVGFDRLFENMAQMSAGSKSLPSYPPFNVVKDGDHYIVEVALAGINKKDLDVEVQENTLSISYDSNKEESDNKLYRGIAQRSFRRQFSLAEDVEVTGASFKNGLLQIDLERIIPEEKQPKQIKIK
jgi:molecular chaperone IbpA